MEPFGNAEPRKSLVYDLYIALKMQFSINFHNQTDCPPVVSTRRSYVDVSFFHEGKLQSRYTTKLNQPVSTNPPIKLLSIVLPLSLFYTIAFSWSRGKANELETVLSSPLYHIVWERKTEMIY